MDLEQSKNALKAGYIKTGLQLVDEHQCELFFTGESFRAHIRISEDEIAEYAEFENLRPSFQVAPTECSLCSKNYREQIVDYADEFRKRAFLGRDVVYTFGEKKEDAQYVEISTASSWFVNFFRFNEAYTQMFIERAGRNLVVHRRSDPWIDMRELLYRPLTVKIYNLNATTVEESLKLSNEIINSCLFEFSYLRNVTLILGEEWPRRQPRVPPFRFGEQFKGNQLPLPRLTLNPDILRFYQRGMSTDDPVNEFLSFYHVLEYFFVKVADDQLYSKLSRRINDPKFSVTPVYLDRIIQDTLDHKRETDETEMLKLVLAGYVDESELMEFIKAYEAYLGDNMYTKKRTIFGEEVEIKLNPGHVIGNVAKRVKIIRNALVHSSDRHERQERYIPTARTEDMIKREIPLLKYLAEKVMIATAK